jgi:hypothetical protein
VANSTSTFNWGKPVASAVRAARVTSDATRALVFGFEKGAQLFSGVSAARRVGLFFGDTTATSLNANGWALFDESVEWAVTTASTPQSVKLTVSNVDDFLFFRVNGVQRKLYRWQESDTAFDVTPWFGSGGANEVSVQVVNTGGPASYSFQLSVDNQVVINEVCSNAPCDATIPANSAIVFSRTYQVQTPNLPARQTVNVTGTTGAKLYLNDVYTGKSAPATFSLPAGTYTLGAGVSQDIATNYTGQFYERALPVTNAAVNVNATGGSSLPAQNTTRIAILPIRNTVHGSGGSANTGVLQQSDITTMNSQTVATRDGYVRPFTYGLTTWSVAVLPTVENISLYRPITNLEDTGADPPDTERFLNDANLQSLKQSYDIIIFLYSNHRPDGSNVTQPAGYFWGTGQSVIMSTVLTRHTAPSAPNVWLLHETLHDYEAYNSWILRMYNGAAGAHGAGRHGYPGDGNGEPDFNWFYRHFMRGQVAEVRGMNFDERSPAWPSPPPASGDLYVGVFDTMRRGVQWPAASSAAARGELLTQAASGFGRPSHVCVLPAPLDALD